MNPSKNSDLGGIWKCCFISYIHSAILFYFLYTFLNTPKVRNSPCFFSFGSQSYNYRLSIQRDVMRTIFYACYSFSCKQFLSE